MTLVRFNQRPADRKVNSFFEDFFSQFPSRLVNDDFVSTSVPVNIRETEGAYAIEVVAPGMDKGDFKVNVDNNILTISAEKKAESNKENERMVRREYSYKSFARTFTLDETINADNIQAKYDNGVLHIELPKKTEAKIQPKEISIQ
ncbi:MAG TPA: Hsp20/alpha crystallin family protein [Chitinophagaceae bacterium]|nr:Hsp20/alpha crystallin family protein [Chitinophagaceae bacterium]